MKFPPRVFHGLCCCLLVSSAVAGSPDIDNAVRRLEDEKFATREAAMLYLWEKGADAEPSIRKALDSQNPETRMRARRVLEAFEMGIRPDTPPDVLKLIYQVRDGNPTEQSQAVEALAKKGELRFLRRLAVVVQDPGTRARLNDLVTRHLKSSILPLIEKGEFDEAGQLLREVAVDDAGMRDLAAFHAVRGALDQALLEAEKDRQDFESWKRRYWLHRAQGNMSAARRLAEEQKDEDKVLSAEGAGGDARAFCRWMLKQPGLDDGSRHCVELTLHRLNGEVDKVTQKAKEMVGWLGQESDANARSEGVEALMMNDRMDDAISVLEKASDLSLFDLQSFRGIIPKAFESVGVKEKMPFLQWGRDLADKLSKKDAKATGTLWTVVAHLFEMGEEAEAERLLAAAAEACADNEPFFVFVLGLEAQLGMEKSALKHTALASEKGVDFAKITAAISGPMDASLRWWGFIQNRRTEWTQAQSLEALWRITRPKKGNPTDFDIKDWLKAAREAAVPLPPQQQAEWLGLLYQTAELHGLEELSRTYLAEWVERSPQIGSLALLGEALMKEGKWKEAAEVYGRAWKAAPKVPSFLYRRAHALAKLGEQAQADRLRSIARLSALGDSAARYYLGVAMMELGEPEAARREWLLCSRLAIEDDQMSAMACSRVAEGLAEMDPAAAARYQERANVAYLRSDWDHRSIRGPVAFRGKALQWEAMGKAREGKTQEALAAVETFHQMQPGNAAIAEALIPLLERMGQGSKAQEYYEKTLTFCQQGVDLYPKSAMLHNNLAWLHARSLRRLDEAMTHAQKALELAPDTPAYLDTLAEVHFVQGNREKALELSRKAVALSPQDSELLGQLRRFEKGDIPKRPGP